jgi:hypothetical protein
MPQASVLLCDYQFAHATDGIQEFRVPAQVVVPLSNTSSTQSRPVHPSFIKHYNTHINITDYNRRYVVRKQKRKEQVTIDICLQHLRLSARDLRLASPFWIQGQNTLGKEIQGLEKKVGMGGSPLYPQLPSTAPTGINIDRTWES